MNNNYDNISFPATVDPHLSQPHLSESSFIRTHKFGGEYHYMFVNLIMCYKLYNTSNRRLNLYIADSWSGMAIDRSSEDTLEYNGASKYDIIFKIHCMKSKPPSIQMGISNLFANNFIL